MGRSRYGIHAMDREHFGMATAEMTRAGCLVFAHASGGSPEVLNHEAGLLWSTEEEAVQRITAISREPHKALAPERMSALRDHVETFSTERFMQRFREIVASVQVS